MTNPFFNTEENRLRAFFRIFLFLFLFSFLMVLPSAIPIMWVQYIVTGLLIFGLYFVMIRYVDSRPWQESGLIINHTWMKEFFAGVGIAFIVMLLIFLTELFTGGLEVTGFGWQRSAEIYWLLPVIAYFIQMLSVGFYEELMARGYLLTNLAEGFTFGRITPHQATITAVVVSSAIFGFGHAGNPNVTIFALLNILFAGVMLAIPFLITGRLALSIGLHFAWNFFQGGIFGFRVSGLTFRNSVIQIQQSGSEWWTGGAFGPEGGLIGVIGISLIVLLTIFYFKISGTELNYSRMFSEKYLKKKEYFTTSDELA